MRIICEDKEITLRWKESDKNSILIVGGSRMGKTFFASHLALNLIQQKSMIHLIDLGEKWGETDKNRLLNAGATLRRVEREKITLSFDSTKDIFGCAKYVVNALGLRSTESELIMKNIFHRLMRLKTIFSLRDILDLLEKEEAECVEKNENRSKLLTHLECFCDMPQIYFQVGDDFMSKSTIWDLSGLDNTYTQIISQIIVYHLLCHQKACFKRDERVNKIFIIIDEFQSLMCDRKSIVGICLTEGQKYGLNLVLITQFLNGNFSEAVVNQFKQGGYRFYFRLTEEEASVVSRQLVGSFEKRKKLYQKLSTLPRGYCLMLGPHSVGTRSEISEKFRLVKIVQN